MKIALATTMIKAIIVVNNHGKPRLVKFYQSVENEAAQQRIIREIYQQVVGRPDSFCNYLEGKDIFSDDGEQTIKIIYRHYATLYFVFAVDSQESDLGILDLIQVFVEALDHTFEAVCELDLIYNSDKVHYILDEMVMRGMVLETNIHSILQACQDQDKKHQASLTQSSQDANHSRSATGRTSAMMMSPSSTSNAYSGDNPSGGSTSNWQYNW